MRVERGDVPTHQCDKCDVYLTQGSARFVCVYCLKYDLCASCYTSNYGPAWPGCTYGLDPWEHEFVDTSIGASVLHAYADIVGAASVKRQRLSEREEMDSLNVAADGQSYAGVEGVHDLREKHESTEHQNSMKRCTCDVLLWFFEEVRARRIFVRYSVFENFQKKHISQRECPKCRGENQCECACQREKYRDLCVRK